MCKYLEYTDMCVSVTKCEDKEEDVVTYSVSRRKWMPSMYPWVIVKIEHTAPHIGARFITWDLPMTGAFGGQLDGLFAVALDAYVARRKGQSEIHC